MVVIVISGKPGSGKSTMAKTIADRYDIKHVSAGDIMRNEAKELGFQTKGVGFLKFHQFADVNEEIDLRVDEIIKKQAKRGEVVIDGWLAGHTVENADIKVYLRTPEEVAAERVSKREGITVENALELNKEREMENLERWKRLYGIDVSDLSPYNIIIDTSLWSIEEMNKIIIYIIDLLLKKKGVL